MNRSPDIEVLFEFNNCRSRPIYDGCRPTHLISDHYLSTGIHHYYGQNFVMPNESAKGTITFIMPEAYPHTCWIGKRIRIQEGERVIGFATITKIFNPLLRIDQV